jgi:hypothetical protein
MARAALPAGSATRRELAALVQAAAVAVRGLAQAPGRPGARERLGDGRPT